MTFTLRPAVREEVGLLIGFAGGTGSGKTLSALKLAKGMTPPGKRFAMIDTENGRAKFYADDFQFDHGDLRAPFSPASYAAAIQEVDKGGYPVIVVDSMSHVWAGDGGVLDMQEAEFKRMGSRDSAKMLSWAEPKGEHKRMVSKLLQVRAHLILCFRAEPKIDIVKVNGKTEIVPKEGPTGLDGWMPISDKNLPFELSASFLLMADRPGYPKPIKLPQSLHGFFPLDQPIDEAAGVRLAEWSRGGSPVPVPASQLVAPVAAPRSAPSSTGPKADWLGFLNRAKELGFDRPAAAKVANTDLNTLMNWPQSELDSLIAKMQRLANGEADEAAGKASGQAAEPRQEAMLT